MTYESQNEPSPTAEHAVEIKPLPKGYLWRLAVVASLLIGGGVCLIFFNGILGSLLTFSGLGFGKYSGLNKMVDSSNS